MGTVLTVAAPVNAQVRDHHVRWLTVRTAHFEVHYPTPLGVLARRAAALCERVHTLLAPELKHEPRRRVQVVLTDTSEGANGSATALPYNAIQLFATAPDDLSALGDYDDWLNLLITHEHAHILHLDNVSGLPAIVNSVLGKVLAPNQAQPRWFIEGVATYLESAYTAGGRLRSSIFDMYLRMAALEDRLLRIDQLSGGIDRWPRGDVFYLYGSRFVAWIVDRYGFDAIAKMSATYGGQLVPYGINRAAKRATGRTFLELYRAWLESVRQDYKKQKHDVESRGQIEGARITHQGETVRSPRFLSSKRLAYFTSDGKSDSQIRMIDMQSHSNQTQTIVRVAGTSYLSPVHDRAVYFSGIDAHRNVYRLNDLFQHDLRSGNTRRLTRGLRARQPDVSRDGKKIAFVVNGAGTTHLMIANTDDVEESKQVLLRSERFDQVFTPRFSPDGKTIAISRWTKGGYRDIYLVDAASGALRRVTSDRASDSGPAWSPDGKTLFFSSDRSGIANIYAYDLNDQRIHQVTNVVAGAYSPAISPDGSDLVYVGYTSRGFDLYRMSLNQDDFLDAPTFVDDRPAPVDYDEYAALPSERYRPFRSLYPRSYRLDLQDDGFGQNLSIEVSGEDAARFYSFSSRVGVSLTEGYVDTEAGFRVNRSPAPIRINAFRRIAPRGGLRVGGRSRRWVEEAIGGSAGISYPLLRRFHTHRFSLDYAVTHIDNREPFGGRLDPNDPPPSVPQLGFITSLRAAWTYSDARRHIYDMTPSEGRTFGVNITTFDPLIDGELRAVSFGWSIARFIENPWVQHHVLSIRYAGGRSLGNLGGRGVFSVGGFPRVDIVSALLDNAPIGGVALRGYPAFSRVGTQLHLTQVEYRFPIGRIMAGPDTLPGYLNRVYASAFFDWGDAFFGSLNPSTFRKGVGGELLLDFTVGYTVGFTLRGGVAFGLDDGGGFQTYLNFGRPF